MSNQSHSTSSNFSQSYQTAFRPPNLPRRPSVHRKPLPPVSGGLLAEDLGHRNRSISATGPTRSPPSLPLTRPSSSAASFPLTTDSQPPELPPRPPTTSRSYILQADPPTRYIEGDNIGRPRLPPPPPPPLPVSREKAFSDFKPRKRNCYPATKRGRILFWSCIAVLVVIIAIVIAVCATVLPGRSSTSSSNGGHPLSKADGGVDIGKPGDIAQFGQNSTDHFVMVSNRSIAVTRLDPIVDPGSVGTHVHRIHGSSYFTQNLTTATDAVNLANCTTAYVQDDKSAYWVPQLYYRYSNGSMVGINMIQTSVYYFQKAPTGVPIYPFPDNYNIVAGNPNRRVVNSSNPAEQALWYICHRGSEGDLRTAGFPDSQCPVALKLGILFPSCWDGTYANDADYASHVAYPTDGINGYYCPKEFPKKLLAIQFETYFSVSDYPFNGRGNNTWVLANGDTSGYGIHADFMNGWNATTLQGVLDDCRYMNGTVDHSGIYAPAPENCPHLNRTVFPEVTYGCRLQTPIVNEAVAEKVPFSTLPGCNAIWEGTGPKPACPSGTVSGGNLNLAEPSIWYREEPYIA